MFISNTFSSISQRSRADVTSNLFYELFIATSYANEMSHSSSPDYITFYLPIFNNLISTNNTFIIHNCMFDSTINGIKIVVTIPKLRF